MIDERPENISLESLVEVSLDNGLLWALVAGAM